MLKSGEIDRQALRSRAIDLGLDGELADAEAALSAEPSQRDPEATR